MELDDVEDAGFFSLQELLEIECKKDDLLLHERGEHYESDDDIYTDSEEAAIETIQESQQEQQQDHHHQPQSETQINVSSTRKKPMLCLGKKENIGSMTSYLRNKRETCMRSKNKIINKV